MQHAATNYSTLQHMQANNNVSHSILKTSKPPTQSRSRRRSVHPVFSQKSLTFSPKSLRCAQKSLTFPQKIPTFSQKSPAFSQKIPTFSQKSPTFSQKSPTFSQKSPTFSQRALHSLQGVFVALKRSLYSLKRALHSLKSPLHSLKRALHSLKRVFVALKISLHSLKRAVHSLKRHIPVHSCLEFLAHPIYIPYIYTADFHWSHGPPLKTSTTIELSTSQVSCAVTQLRHARKKNWVRRDLQQHPTQSRSCWRSRLTQFSQNNPTCSQKSPLFTQPE